MFALIFSYLVLPFCLAAILIRLIRKYGGDPIPPEIRALCTRDPIERKCFRTIRAQGTLGHDAVVTKLGDYESQQEAVDAAYQAAAAARTSTDATDLGFFVVNDKGEVLQQA